MINECSSFSFSSPELKTPITYTIRTKSELPPAKKAQREAAFEGFSEILADKFFKDPDKKLKFELQEKIENSQLSAIGAAYMLGKLDFNMKEVLLLNPTSALKFIETVSSKIKQKEPQGPQQDF